MFILLLFCLTRYKISYPRVVVFRNSKQIISPEIEQKRQNDKGNLLVFSKSPILAQLRAEIEEFRIER